MVIMMESLSSRQDYKLETLFLAVSIADRYLIYLANRSTEAPCLVLLGFTSMMLAAKLEQSIVPCFEMMYHFLVESHGIGVSYEKFLKLELEVLKALQFELNYISPIPFLERF